MKLKNSDYFKINEIVFSEKDLNDLSYLKGHNIFSVDLDRESFYLLRKFPDYRKIRVIRVFPNRLYVDFVKRMPLAYVKLYRLFYVDRDSVLFNAPELVIDPTMPVISGLETKIFGPKAGTRYDIKELRAALEIIKEIKNNRVFKDYSIKRVDIADFTNISVFLSFVSPVVNTILPQAGIGELLEIKIGPDHIADKLNILSSLLSQVNSDRFNIKYIDLRFKEPVIKLKDKDNASKGGKRP
ncbi:MAG: hypothetical protein WC543_06640 [Candidatus Omnitrophota bacterium]